MLGPAGLPEVYFRAVSSLCAGLGIYLAGIACTHQGGSLKATLAATIVGVGAGTANEAAADEHHFDSWAVLLGIVAFQWTRRWEPEHTKRRPRLWKVLFGVMLFWSAFSYGVYEHGHIKATEKDGTETTHKVKDCIWNVIRGINFEDMRKT